MTAKTQKKRQRNSVNLSEEAKSAVREALYFKGLSQQGWADKAYISISTVKRFLSGQRIDRYSFEAACISLELNPDELIAHLNYQRDSTIPSIPVLVSPPLVPVPPEPSLTHHLGTPPQNFMITGTFSPNKLAEIEVALTLLEKLLGDSATFTLVPEHNYLAVTGTFSKDKKPHVEVALMHLKKLLLEHFIIPEWME